MRRQHRKLGAGQQSIALVEDVHRLTASFPPPETRCLSAQMRRAAVSVPSSIAAGAARNGPGEFIHLPGIARGSLSESDTQPTIARNLGVTDAEHHGKPIDEIFALLGGPINSLRDKKP